MQGARPIKDNGEKAGPQKHLFIIGYYTTLLQIFEHPVFQDRSITHTIIPNFRSNAPQIKECFPKRGMKNIIGVILERKVFPP
jgi:hypothetical protein